MSFFNAGTATANSFKAMVSVGLSPIANMGSRSSLRSVLILCFAAIPSNVIQTYTAGSAHDGFFFELSYKN